MELYGSPTTKEIKKEIFIQTSRRGGDGQPGQRGLLERQWLTDLAGGGLWNRAGQAAASRPHKVVAGRPCGLTFTHR